MNYPRTAPATLVALTVLLAGCGDTPETQQLPTEALTPDSPANARQLSDDPYTDFDGVAFDIAATPNGGILIADGATIKEIRPRGGTGEIATIPTLDGEGPIGVEATTPVNGLVAIGQGNFFATRGGLDHAKGAALFRGSHGGVRLVADIESFELENNPDALEGLQWKDDKCEGAQGFTAGPQSNPYHLTALSGSEVLIGDAAGNMVLWAKTNGKVDWVALPTPPAEGGATSTDPNDWLSWFTFEDGTECYVQPVPTSVAVGPDGDYFVGELTGVTAENLAGEASPGLSRVWKIKEGARNVVCPSDDCEVVISGLTSVIDVEFGSDGMLYVVEYDANGWFGALELGMGVGGTIKSCDVNSGMCGIVEGGLTLPGAITFDKWGNLWILENTFSPTVRRVN